MKKLLSLLLLATVPAFAGTFHCTWNLIDFTTTPYNVRQIRIQSIAPYGVHSNAIITGDYFDRQVNSSGSVTVSNLVNGRSYRVTFFGPTVQTVFTNSFDTNVTGLVNGADYIAAPITDGNLVGWSRTQADARFLRTNITQYLRQGTNIVFVTNGNSLTIHGTATGGSGLGNPLTENLDFDGWLATNVFGLRPQAGETIEIQNAVIDGTFTGDGAAITNVTATIFVATNGNNATGQRGQSTLPFRNIYNASAVAQRGDTISVGPGVFNETNIINVPNDGFLVGAGQQVTFITNWNYAVSTINGVLIHPSTNSVLEGFTVVDGQRGNSSNTIYAAAIGTYANTEQGPFLNAVIRNITILGSSDGFYIQHSNACSATLENVTIDSDWDSIMVKAEPGSDAWVPHSLTLIGCNITGTHGGGWTNRTTYGAAMHTTGGRMWIYNSTIRMTNTTFAGSSAAVSSVLATGDVKVWVQNSALNASVASAGFTGSEDDKWLFTDGVNFSQAYKDAQTGTVYNDSSLLAKSLSGINLPPSVTNWGGIPFLQWTSGGSNSWALTRTNAGAGGILHRPAATGSVNGNPTSSAGEPYFGPVLLNTEVSGALSTWRLDWGSAVDPDMIIATDSTGTNLQGVTIGTGLDYTAGVLSATGGAGSGIATLNGTGTNTYLKNVTFGGLGLFATNGAGDTTFSASSQLGTLTVTSFLKGDELRLPDDDASAHEIFQAPGVMASNLTWVFPALAPSGIQTWLVTNNNDGTIGVGYGPVGGFDPTISNSYNGTFTGTVIATNASLQTIGAIDADALLQIQTGDGGIFIGTSGDLETDCNSLLLSADGDITIRTLSAGSSLTLQDVNVQLTGAGEYRGNGAGLTNLNLTGLSHTNAPYISATNLDLGTLRFYDTDASAFSGFRAAAVTLSNLTHILPDRAPASAKLLVGTNNNDGTISWGYSDFPAAGTGTNSPIVLTNFGGNIEATNTTSEVTVLTVPVAADQLGSNSVIEINASTFWFNNLSSATNTFVRVYVGDQIAAADMTVTIAATSTRRKGSLRFCVRGANSTAAQTVDGLMVVGAGQNMTTGWGDFGVSPSSTQMYGTFGGDAAIGVNTNFTISVTVSNSSAGACSFWTRGFSAVLYP